MYDFGSSPRRDFFDSFREHDPEEEDRINRAKGLSCDYDYENEFDREDMLFCGTYEEEDDLEELEEILESIRLLFQ